MSPLSIALAFLFFGLSGVRASELSSLLKKPVSPASIALLAPFSQDPAVIERWTRALGSDDPRVRGVAARAIDACGMTAAIPEVARALGVEKDLDATREEIRALLLLGDGKDDDLVLSAAARFDGALDGDVLRAFARARGSAAIPLYYLRFRKLLLTREDLTAFLRIASRGGAESLAGGAAMAFGRRDIEIFRAILGVSGSDRALAASALLRSALSSPEPGFRSEAAWFLAERWAGAPPSAEDRKAALEALRLGEAGDLHPSAVPADRIGPELLRRVLGEKPTPVDPVLFATAGAGTGHLGASFPRGPLARFLAESERGAIPASAASGEAAAPEPDPTYWAVSDLPPGLGEDLLRVAPCGGASAAGYGFAEVAFRPDGRPAHVTLRSGPEQSTCDLILKTVFLLSLAPADQPTTPDKLIYLQTMLQPAVLACTDETARDPVVTRGIASMASLITPPKIASKVEPIYPNLSGRDRFAGVVTLAGVVSPSGCIHGAHVVRSSGAIAIDVATMLAFLQWRYTPATLNRQAIPYPVGITYTYKLYD